MSIVKDFVLIFSVFFALAYCFYLKYYIKLQKEYFLNILKHDIKVPILAKKHALDLLQNTDNLVKNIKDAENRMLDLINSAISAYESNFEYNQEFIPLSELIVDIFKTLDKKAEDKKITFYYMVDETLTIYTNKVHFAEVITYLTVLLIQNSPNYGKIMCSAKIVNKILKLEIKGYSIRKINNINPLKNRLMPVGHGIKMLFCKNFIQSNNWKIKESFNKNDIDTFTIEIPMSKINILLKPSDSSNFEHFAPYVH